MDPLDAPDQAEYTRLAFEIEPREVLAFPEGPFATSGFKYYTNHELAQLTAKAGAHYISQGLKPRRKGDRPLVVAIYAAGTIEWLATFYALILMGHSVLVLASRISGEVVDALMKKGNGDFVIHDEDRSANILSPEQGIPIVTRDQLNSSTTTPPQPLCESGAIDPDKDVATITHSSGSTGIPKLFPVCHGESVEKCRVLKAFIIAGGREWIASAVYNSVGQRLSMAALTRSDPLIYDNDRVPVTADALVTTMKECRPSSAWLTSFFLELILTHPEGLKYLKQIEHIHHLGAVLPKSVGDQLVENDMEFDTVYGLTECGNLLNSRGRGKGDKDWQWMDPVSYKKDYYLFRPVGKSAVEDEQLYELILLDGCPEIDESVKRSDDPPNSFHVGDLFLKHPTKPDRWKIVGRIDDQLKIYQAGRQIIVNAMVYEEKIKIGNEDVLDEVVLFGQGMNKLGVLIFAGNATGKARDNLIERVWSTIQKKVNNVEKVAVEKDMLVIVSDVPSVDLPRTTKLNFIRPQVYMKFKELIDASYEAKANGHANGHTNGVAH